MQRHRESLRLAIGRRRERRGSAHHSKDFLIEHRDASAPCSISWRQRDAAARGVTVVAVLHDLNLAALFAGHIVVLDQCRIVADGRPAEIITDATPERVFGVTGAIGRVPSPGLPFVLPHAMARVSGTSTRTSPRP